MSKKSVQSFTPPLIVLYDHTEYVPCKLAAADVDKWAEDDQEEYVGVDDERLQYKDFMLGEDTSD